MKNLVNFSNIFTHSPLADNCTLGGGFKLTNSKYLYPKNMIKTMRKLVQKY